MILALFDLDNTLLPIDSDYAWGEFSQRIGWTDPATFKARNDQFYADYQAGVLDIHDYVRFATEAVRIRGAEAAEQAHLQLMQEVILPAVKLAATEVVKHHQEVGDHVMSAGEIAGTPSLKEGKVARVAQWLADRGRSWPDVHITFYSDSVNDLPLLEMAQTPVATNPDARLRQLATDRGWRTLQLFS